MVCEWRRDVSAYYDAELDRERSADVKRHIEECKECSDFLRRLNVLESLHNQKDISEEVSEEDWNSCWQRIKEETTRRVLRRKRVGLMRRILYIGAAALLVVCLLFGYYMGTGPSSESMPGFADGGTLEIIDYSDEYALMLMETEEATIIIMMED